MATLRLNERRVHTLKPHKSSYDVRDRELTGFGVRVLPSGAKRYFIHSQHHGRRVWKIIGRAGSIGVDEARDRARVTLASIRNGTDEQAAAPQDTVFETVGDEVFRRYARNWKPSTLKVNRNYYRNHILPWFEGRPIGDIAAHDVRRWFASLHSTPVSADRSAPILSVIMRQAEVYGYRPEGTNPCAGIRRYRRQGRERFLSVVEISRLGEVLARHEADHPKAVAIIRLLLLTGCRRGEILTLKWHFYREGKLFLPDSKTGPRTVWLSSAARAILDDLPRKAAWVFPSPITDSCLYAMTVLQVWHSMRAEAELCDVRLHDLRHTHASIALRQGETVLAIGRLLGHRNAETTLKYTHPRTFGANYLKQGRFFSLILLYPGELGNRQLPGCNRNRENGDGVNGGGIMLHAERPGGPVAAAQKCANHGPLSVATRGGRYTAWSSMRRFDWRLSTRV